MGLSSCCRKPQCWVILRLFFVSKRWNLNVFMDLSTPQQVQSTLIWRESGYSHSRRFRPRFHISCRFLGGNLQATSHPSYTSSGARAWIFGSHHSWEVDTHSKGTDGVYLISLLMADSHPCLLQRHEPHRKLIPQNSWLMARNRFKEQRNTEIIRKYTNV